MISSKVNEPDRVLIKQRNFDLLKHYEKLKEIKKAENKPDLSSRTFAKSKPASNTERYYEINRENKILFAKIFKIFHRKPEKLNVSYQSQKSLNILSRNERVSKINQENEKIAERIGKQKPLILKKKFEEDFLLHLKYKTQLSKHRLIKYKENLTKRTSPRTPTFQIQKSLPKLHSNRTPVPVALTRRGSSSYSDDFSN